MSLAYELPPRSRDIGYHSVLLQGRLRQEDLKFNWTTYQNHLKMRDLGREGKEGLRRTTAPWDKHIKST